MSKVLVLTYESDPHADSVCNFFKKNNIDFFVVNTERLITDYSLTFDLSSGYYSISDGERGVLLTDEWSIWNRRVLEPVIPDSIPADLHNIILTETERTWQGLLFSHKGRVVNKPQANFNANNKVDQLLFAKSNDYGVMVPDTILTNNPGVLRDFYNSHDLICNKLLQVPMVIRNGEYLAVYTNIVSEENMRYADLIKYYPALFQEYINKDYELRITVLEDKVVPIAIHSQESMVSRVDFRRYDFVNVNYELVSVPKSVEDFCFSLINHYGLLFAEVDMIYTNDGEYYFLEVNPNGQWLWLEEQSGYDLTSDVARNLL